MDALTEMEARDRWSPNEVALHEEEQARLRQSEPPRQQRGAALRLGNDRSNELRRAESQEKRLLVQQHMELNHIADDIAAIIMDEQFDALDTNLAHNFDYARAQVARNLAAIRDVHDELDCQSRVLDAVGEGIDHAQDRVRGMQTTLDGDGTKGGYCIIA